MGNAIWVFFTLPLWYFPQVLYPFGAGWLSIIPAVGVVCFAVGLILGAIRGSPRLIGFLVPVLAAQALVATAGYLRGQVMAETADQIVTAFLGGQLILVVVLIAWARGARPAATALALFSLSYAWFAGVVATMAFTDRWL